MKSTTTILTGILTLVPFMTPDIGSTGTFFGGLFGAQPGASLALPRGLHDTLAIAAGGTVLLWMHLQEFSLFARASQRFFRLPAPIRGMAYGGAIAALVLLVPVGAGTFIYRNF